MYRHMLRSRVLDERMWVLNRQGRAPFWISGMGHEAIQVAVGMNMDPARDWLAPYYRDLALTLWTKWPDWRSRMGLPGTRTYFPLAPGLFQPPKYLGGRVPGQGGSTS